MPKSISLSLRDLANQLTLWAHMPFSKFQCWAYTGACVCAPASAPLPQAPSLVSWPKPPLACVLFLRMPHFRAKPRPPNLGTSKPDGEYTYECSYVCGYPFVGAPTGEPKIESHHFFGRGAKQRRKHIQQVSLRLIQSIQSARAGAKRQVGQGQLTRNHA